MIKAIIFDVGGVLIRTSSWSLRQKWEDKLGLGMGELEKIVFGPPMGLKAQHGEITNSELWQWIGERLELSGSALADLRKDFWANDELDNEIITLIRKMRARYQTAIISNATDDLIRLLNEDYHIGDDFDLIVCSAEEGVMKPDAEIYERALKRLELNTDEVIFIDDSSENIRGAKTLGISAVHFAPDMNLGKVLSEYGIIIGGQS